MENAKHYYNLKGIARCTFFYGHKEEFMKNVKTEILIFKSDTQENESTVFFYTKVKKNIENLFLPVKIEINYNVFFYPRLMLKLKDSTTEGVAHPSEITKVKFYRNQEDINYVENLVKHLEGLE